MKKLLLSIFAVLSLMLGPGLLLTGQAAAVNVFQPCNSAANVSSVCKDAKQQGSSNTNPIINVLKIVIQILAIIIGLASIIVIIVSGLRMITATGDSQAISNARNGLIYALAGLAIAIFAQAVVAFVLNRIQ